MPLADFANRIPNVSVEYVKDGELVFLTRNLKDTEPDEPSGDAQTFTMDPLYPYAWAMSTGGLLVKYDLSGASPTNKIRSTDNFGVGNLATDGVSVWIPATDSEIILYKYDALTLAKIAQSPADSGAAGWGLEYHASPTHRYVSAYFAGNIVILDADTCDVLTDHASDAGHFPASPDYHPTMTPDGVFWTSGRVGGVTTVFKAELVTTPLAAHPYTLDTTATYNVNSVFAGASTQVTYYADEDCLLIFGTNTNKLAKFDYGSGTIIASMTLPGNIEDSDPLIQRGPINGKQWLYMEPLLVEVDLANMQVARSYSRTNWGVNALDEPGFDATTESFIAGVGVSAVRTQLYLPRIDPLDVERADVITQYSKLANVPESRIDVSLVTTTVKGYTNRRNTTARDALEPIQELGLIEPVSVDGKIRWVQLGGAAIVTIPEDDLGAGLSGEDSDTEKLIETIPQETNLPERVTILYRDRENQYDQGAQSAKRARELINTREQMTFDTPEVTDKDVARQWAETRLYRLWAEKPVKFSLTRKYLDLIGTDPINVEAHGKTFRIKITKIAIGPYLECEGVIEDVETLSSSATGGESSIPQQVLQLLSPTQLFLIDSNLIRDEDNDGGHYLGIAPTVSDGLWDGAQIFKSSDNVSYQAFDSFTTAVEWGAATSVLASHHCTTTDRWNTLDIQMINGELSSVTEADMLNGSNAFLLQSGNDWELIQAADVEDLGGGKYRLSILLRGRRGTEQAASGHAAGDKFIVLSTSTMQRIQNASEIGQERFYKPVTFGALFSPTGAVEFTNTARGRECYAPEHVKGARDGSNNLSITWSRRSRIGDELDWNDNVAEPPLGEDSEAYEVYIPNAVPPRTISVTSETASYPAVDQAADGFTPGDSIDVIVYQMSASNGRGRPGSATI